MNSGNGFSKTSRPPSLWLIGLTVVLVILLFSYKSYVETKENYHQLVSLDIERKFDHLKKDFENEYTSVLKDLSFFSTNQVYPQYLASNNKNQNFERQAIEKTLAKYGLLRGVYNRIQLVDVKGVNQLNIVYSADDFLMNTESTFLGDSSLLDDLENTKTNTFYLSRLRFNEENHPEIVFATPIVNPQKAILGYLVLHYNAEAILTEVRRLSKILSYNIYLLDHEGQWILGPTKDSVSNTHYQRVDQNHPRILQTIQGEVYHSDLPLQEVKVNSLTQDYYLTSDDQSFWIYSHMKDEEGMSFYHFIKDQVLFTLVVLVIVLLVFAYSNRLIKKKRREVESINLALKKQNAILADHKSQLNEYIKELQNKEVELKKAKENAEQLARDKADFIAVLSHEIRTPLNAVLGMAELLEDTQLSAEQQSLLRSITTSGQGLMTLLNKVLDFSKIEAGKMELEQAEFSLVEAIETALIIQMFKSQEKGLHLQFIIESPVPDFSLGDSSRMVQVLLNLLSNSIKFTEKGGVTLRLRAKDESGSTHFTLTVEDTGIGIAPGINLFEKYSQADDTINRRFGGSGLGLVISKGIVESMDGTLSYQSKEGQGTTFTVSFTLRNASAVREKLDKPLYLWGDEKEVTPLLKTFHFLGEKALLHTPDTEEDGYHLLLTEVANPPKGAIIMGSKKGPAADNRLNPPMRFLKILEVVREGIQETTDAESTKNLEEALSLRILVADDSAANQKVITYQLEKLGITPRIAHHGKEALEMVVQDIPDIVLMDIQMPIMDGIEATVKIRQKLGDKSPVIIALTANVLEEDHQFYLDMGLQDVLTKPLLLGVLQQKLIEWKHRIDSANRS